MNDNFNNYNGYNNNNNNPMNQMGGQNSNGNMGFGGVNPMGNQPYMNQTPSQMNQPYMPYQNPEPKKSKTTLIIIIVLIAIVVSCGTYFTIRLVEKKKAEAALREYEASLKKEEEEKEKINKNFTVEDYVLANGNVLLVVKNNNDVTVDGKIKVEFYNEQEQLVNSEDGYFFFLRGNKTVYTDIFLSESEKSNYSKYKVTVKLDKSLESTQYHDKITINSSKTNDNILIQVTNNSDDTIKNIDVGVLFYDQDKKIIGFGEALLTDVKSKETTSGKVYLPHDKNYDDLAFDSYEVVVNAAYSSNY